MAKINVIEGKNAFLFRKPASTFVPIGCANKYSIKLNSALEKVMCDATGLVPDYEATELSGTIDISGINVRTTGDDVATNTTVAELRTLLQTQAKFSLFITEDATPASSEKATELYVTLTSLSEDNENSKVGTFSATAQLLPIPNNGNLVASITLS